MKPFDPRVLRIAPDTRRPVVVLGVIGILAGVAAIGTAFALTALVVDVVTGQSWYAAAVALLALFAARGALAALAEVLQAWAGTRVAAALRARLVRHWLDGGERAQQDPARAATLTAHGCAAVEPYAAKFLPALIHAAVVPALAILTLALVDWSSALIVVLTVPLLPLFAALIGQSTADDTATRWAALTALAGHFLDVMRGLPTLVVYGRAKRQVDTIDAVSQRHRQATMRTLRLAFLSSAALELLASLSVAVVAVWVGLRLAHGGMDLYPGLLAILLAPEAYWPIRRVGAEFHAAADGAEAIADILTELGPQPDGQRPWDGTGAAADCGPSQERGCAIPSSRAAVRVRGLGYTHPGAARAVVDGLDADLGPGLAVVTGPSGVGKSTLLEVIAGLRTPDTGSLTTPAVAHLVSQRPFLAATTIRSNLALGNTAAEEAMWRALRTVAIAEMIQALPQGLDSALGDDGVGLSAGQRARLVLARAVLSDAPLVLLDEPTAHLDAGSADVVHEVIADLARTRTVVVVTHRSELVALADTHLDLQPAADTIAAGRGAHP